jgi:hypothetical protein
MGRPYWKSVGESLGLATNQQFTVSTGSMGIFQTVQPDVDLGNPGEWRCATSQKDVRIKTDQFHPVSISNPP